MKKILLFCLVLMLSFSFISASSLQYNYLEKPTIKNGGGTIDGDYNFTGSVTIDNLIVNYSSTNVNYSDFSGNAHLFDGYSVSGLYSYYRGLLETYFNGVYCKLTGCTMSGVLNMDNNDIYNVRNINTSNLSITSLTSGRIPIVSTGGLLTDSSKLTWTGNTAVINTGSPEKLVSLTNQVGEYYLQGYTFHAPSSFIFQSPAGYLSFETSDVVYFKSGGSETARFTNNHNLLIQQTVDSNAPLLAGGTGGIIANDVTDTVGSDPSLEFKYGSYTSADGHIARIRGYTQSGGGGDILFETASSGSGSYSERMRLLRNGNFGIGVSSPAKILELTSNSTYPNLQLSTSTAGGWIQTTSNNLYLAPYSGIVNLYDSVHSFSQNIYNFSTLAVKINSNGDSYFNGGNIGIGTSTPTAPVSSKVLHLKDTYPSIAIESQYKRWEIASTYFVTTPALVFYEGTSARMMINEGGNVLVGTTTDSGNRLNVVDTSGDPARFEGQFGTTVLRGHVVQMNRSGTNYLYANSVGGELAFTVNGSALGSYSMAVKPTGNVIINTAIDNGVDKLQVNGSIKATDVNVTNGFTGSCINITYSGGIAISCND